MDLVLIALIMGIATLFAGVAAINGVDSRLGSDDPRSPADPVGIS
jgi:hypothetical protein